MATRFEISQQSLIKKYENLNNYFKKWNVSDVYVESHSTPQNLRRNRVKASWANYYANNDAGLNLIETRIEELKQAKTLKDLKKFKEEMGNGSVQSFLFNQTNINRKAWTETVLDKFEGIYQGLNKGYGRSTIDKIYIYIEELKMYVKDFDASKLTVEQLNKIEEYMELYYEEIKNKDKLTGKENLLKIAKILHDNQKYKKFETILDNTL